MKPVPAPHVPGNTEWERFDNAVAKLLSVPKEAFLKAEARLKKTKARKRVAVTRRVPLDHPAYSAVEQALLLYIFKFGGASYFVRTSETYKPLADQFGLTVAQREKLTDPDKHGKRYPFWQIKVRFAREQLCKSGFIVRDSPRGIWRLTETGIAEARSRARSAAKAEEEISRLLG